MKILDRYLLRELVVPFLIGQAAIILILVGTMLYNNANVLLMNQVPVVFVVRMTLWFLPFLVHMTMPVAVAVGASLAVSRLARDSEISVMRASGISLFRIFSPYIVLGLAISIGDFYFGEYVVPPSIRQLNQVFAEIPMHLKRIVPQASQYITSNDQGYALMVRQLIPQKDYIELHDIQIVASPAGVYSGQTEPLIVTADKGKYQNGYWILEKPMVMHYKDRKRMIAQPEVFRLYTVVDPQAFQAGFTLQFPMWQLGQYSAIRTFSQLGEDIRKYREQKYTDYFALMDYHFKLSVPFSCLVMALCCPPMAHRFARAGGFMGVLLSIFLVFFYWNTMLLMRILGSPGADGKPPYISPIMAAWTQNVLFVAMGWITLRRSE